MATSQPKPMRMAYADPPSGCWETIKRLCDEFPDGWALSVPSPSLASALAVCPGDCRVGAWAKPYGARRSGLTPAVTWEPLIWRGGRKRRRGEAVVRDHLYHCASRTRERPHEFYAWVFSLLNLMPGDEFVDVHGGATAAWERWSHRKAVVPGGVITDLFAGVGGHE